MATINGFLTDTAVRQVADWIDHPDTCRQVTADNYRIARRHFSYDMLQERLNQAMAELPGNRFRRMVGGDQKCPVHPRRPADIGREPTAADIQLARACN
jgi:hypothetical protein